METKVCNKCGAELPITKEFFNTRTDSPDGFRNDCKICHGNKSKSYNIEHPRKAKRKTYNTESLEGEIWKEVVGYEGLYQISNFGRIKSLEKRQWNGRTYYIKESRILKPGNLLYGYKHVFLAKDGVRKDWRVHRLVALAFIPNPLKLPEVNHKDETPSNSNASNLEWCTGKYNSNYGNHSEHMSKAKSKTVYQYSLDGKLIKKWTTAKETLRGGYTRSNITLCCRGEKEKYKGYKWSYTLLKESDISC